MGNALNSPLRVAVIGGVNMDIGGRPNRPPILHDSNPGTVSLRPGGVGRNIAHNLHLLGIQVSLIAPLGDDMFGRRLLRQCSELGLDMSLSPVLPGEHSSVYLYVSDERGEMALAIADMDITRRLTPELLEPRPSPARQIPNLPPPRCWTRAVRRYSSAWGPRAFWPPDGAISCGFPACPCR